MDIVQISQAGSCAIDTFQVSINDTIMVSVDTRLILQPEILLHTKKKVPIIKKWWKLSYFIGLSSYLHACLHDKDQPW